MTHGKTYNKSPRRINHNKATKSKTNTCTTALERSVEQTTGGFKALLQLANFTLGPDATLNTEIHKNSVRVKAPNSVNASKRKHKNQINQQRRVLMANSTVCRFDILHNPESITNVSVHLNENGHFVDDFSFTPIDKVENEWPRLLKETYWMHLLKTLSPNGMNTNLKVFTRFLKLEIFYL